jgi:UDP-2,4-diacetamido-2,4,6-trideoxy-beta-L-altropyranose hydrolase
MTDEDLTLVWKWRNHPEICQYARSGQSISWGDHQAWSNSFGHRYIFTEDGRTIGVVTLDAIYGHWSFYLDPDLPKGKGYGQLMLSLFLNHIKTQLTWFSEIKADVLQTNPASIKLHTKLGFETVQVKDGIHEFSLKLR